MKLIYICENNYIMIVFLTFCICLVSKIVVEEQKEKQLEVDFVDKLVNGKFLSDEITPETYLIWEQAYRKSLKIRKRNG